WPGHGRYSLPNHCRPQRCWQYRRILVKSTRRRQASARSDFGHHDRVHQRDHFHVRQRQRHRRWCHHRGDISTGRRWYTNTDTNTHSDTDTDTDTHAATKADTKPTSKTDAAPATALTPGP